MEILISLLMEPSVITLVYGTEAWIMEHYQLCMELSNNILLYKTYLLPSLLCLRKRPDFDGYGFNLHAEKMKPGQYIGSVDDDSPAQAAGLKSGDKIIEVNGVNICTENHRQAWRKPHPSIHIINL